MDERLPASAAPPACMHGSSRKNIMRVVCIEADDSGLVAAEAVLRSGGCVGLPTETVYGLAAVAVDASAVRRLFDVKGRPLSDPVICHVAQFSPDAENLFAFGSEEEREVFRFLANEFWPGPLTLVGRAAAAVPRVVTAGGPYVAVRCPAHPTALALLRRVRLPLAAPSANRFGHISPSTPGHVADDFTAIEFEPQPQLLVLDGGPCEVGIESTVCKVEVGGGKIRMSVLRHGHVGRSSLQRCLQRYASRTEGRLAVVDASGPGAAGATAGLPSDDALVAKESPGMMISHYAPSVKTTLLEVDWRGADAAAATFSPPTLARLGQAVLVDVNGRLATAQKHALAYVSLGGSLRDVERDLYSTLRWAERVALEKGAEEIFIADFGPDIRDAADGESAFVAVYDRVLKAASSTRCRLD